MSTVLDVARVVLGHRSPQIAEIVRGDQGQGRRCHGTLELSLLRIIKARDGRRDVGSCLIRLPWLQSSHGAGSGPPNKRGLHT